MGGGRIGWGPSIADAYLDGPIARPAADCEQREAK